MVLKNPFKKVSPDELKTKLAISEQRLTAREKDLKKKQQKAREEAKEALAKGNDREFRVASRRYSMVEGQVNTIGSMVEMAQSMTDVIEMQIGLKEVVEIGEDLGQWQKQLGFDTSKLEGAVTTIRTSMDRVNTATTMMTSTMDAAMGGNTELTELQDSLRSELLAELSSTQPAKDELSKKIESELAESK
jgi:chaperonin cofactor prefoldin